MPSIHIPDDVFAQYVLETGNAREAKSEMQSVVSENAPQSEVEA